MTFVEKLVSETHGGRGLVLQYGVHSGEDIRLFRGRSEQFHILRRDLPAPGIEGKLANLLGEQARLRADHIRQLHHGT